MLRLGSLKIMNIEIRISLKRAVLNKQYIVQILRYFIALFINDQLFQVKKNNNNSLKHLTTNSLIRDIQNLINNSILDQGEFKKNFSLVPVGFYNLGAILYCRAP